MSNKEKKEIVFVEGMYFKLPSVNAPEWIKGKLSIDCDEFAHFINDHRNKGGYVNIELKIAKTGKPYCELDLWEPTNKQYKDKNFNDLPSEEVVGDDRQGEVPMPDGVDYPEEHNGDIPF